MSAKNTVLSESFVPEEEEGTSFDLISDGKYKAIVTSATASDTKNGRGTKVDLTWSIDEGDYEKRLVFQSILIRHESQKAEQIGRQKMKDLCIACGVTAVVTDLDVFLFKPCQIGVATETDPNGQYPSKNKVTFIRPYVAPWNGPTPVKTTKLAQPVNTPSPKEDVALNDQIPF
jgi:Protein of unknown function (DUF669)